MNKLRVSSESNIVPREELVIIKQENEEHQIPHFEIYFTKEMI